MPSKIEWIKKHQLWQQVRDIYIDKKNNNTDNNKKSRSFLLKQFIKFVSKTDINKPVKKALKERRQREVSLSAAVKA